MDKEKEGMMEKEGMVRVIEVMMPDRLTFLGIMGPS